MKEGLAQGHSLVSGGTRLGTWCPSDGRAQAVLFTVPSPWPLRRALRMVDADVMKTPSFAGTGVGPRCLVRVIVTIARRSGSPLERPGVPSSHHTTPGPLSGTCTSLCPQECSREPSLNFKWFFILFHCMHLILFAAGVMLRLFKLEGKQ